MIEWGDFGRKSLEFIATPVEQDARITILEGSVRSAKTVTMIPKWINYIKNGPRGLLAMTGVSKTTLYHNVLDDLFDTVGKRNYRYNKTTGDLWIYNRKLIVFGIKDEGSEKYLRGKTLAGAYSDETTTMPESSFTQLLNRLSVRNARFYGTTNPDSPYHYLHRDYIANQEKIAAGIVRSIHFDLNDNPNLDDEYITFIRGAYSGLWYKRMIQGLWVIAEGSIYDMFDDARNTCALDDVPFDKFYRKLLVSDYGAGNPTTFLKIGLTRDKRGKVHAWIYDEWYYDPSRSISKTTSQYKTALIRFIGDERFDKIYPDPSALDFINELRASSCGRSFDNIGWADNEVLKGINTVSTFIDQGRFHIVKSRCPETMMEFASYIWDPNAQLRGEDEPMKEHDHCLDPIRYGLHTEYPAVSFKRIFV